MLPVARLVRRGGRLSLALGAAVLLAACSGGTGFTPLPSGAPLPSDCATADAQNVITMSADNLEFSAPCIVAPADTAFTIHFTNLEGVPHDVAIYADGSKQDEDFRGNVITGPDTSIDYSVDPIPAGDHFFVCTVHPAMQGAVYVR